MKKIYLYLSLLLTPVLVLISSCKNETELTLTPQYFISIAELREMYQGESLILMNKDDGDLFIGGVVISNPDHMNNPEGKMIIQNYDKGQLRGIALALDKHLERYKEGDSVVVKLGGGILERVNGMLQVSGLTVLDVGKISSNNEQKVHIVTDIFDPFLSDDDTYECTLVQLVSVDVLNVERGQTFGVKDIELSDGSNTILVKTLNTASFAGLEVPISGDFTGVMLYAGSQQPYLSLRSSADYNGEFMAPENYVGFPEGFETIFGSRKVNANTDGYDDYPSGRWFLQKAISNSSANVVHKNEDWGVMLNKDVASISMDFDLMFGATKLSFYYAAATKAPGDSSPITVYAEYSQDAGETWITLEPELIVDDQNVQYFKEYELNIKGSVRFRIRKNDSPARLVVDDIFIKPNTE